MGFLYIFLIIVFLVGILGLVYVTVFNNLQYTNAKIVQSEEVIHEVLNLRYDIVVRTSEIVKKNLKEKKDYFKEFLSLKNEKDIFEKNNKLKEAMNIISNLRDDYPSLQKNKDLKGIMSEIKATDEKLSAAILYYNRYTKELNELVHKFPSNIISKFHHYSSKTLFEGKIIQSDGAMDFKL